MDYKCIYIVLSYFFIKTTQMTRYFITTILLLFSSFSYSQDFDFLTAKAPNNTFNISCDSKGGTGFFYKQNEKVFVVSAKHIFPKYNNGDSIVIKVYQNDGWKDLGGKIYFHTNSIIDIAVIYATSQDLSNFSGLDLANYGLMYADKGFFLGFPFGMKSKSPSDTLASFPVPIVKDMIYSGSITEKGATMYLFGGDNNPGFSGGPLLMKNRRKSSKQSGFNVVAVISGYRQQRNKTSSPIGVLEYAENSGIIISYDARYISEIIKQNLLD